MKIGDIHHYATDRRGSASDGAIGSTQGPPGDPISNYNSIFFPISQSRPPSNKRLHPVGTLIKLTVRAGLFSSAVSAAGLSYFEKSEEFVLVVATVDTTQVPGKREVKCTVIKQGSISFS